jgi:hypothetical protein
MRELPPRARVFVVGVVLVAIASTASAVVLGPRFHVASVLTLGAMFGLLSAFSVATTANTSASVAYIVSLAAIPIFGWAAAGVVGAFGVFVRAPRARIRLVKAVFNGAQFAISGLLAALAFRAVSPTLSGSPPTWRLILGMVVAAAVYVAVNSLLLSTVVSLTSGLAAARVFQSGIAQALVTQLGYALIGVLFAQIYVDFGPVSAVFVLAPLLIARQAFANYAELRSAYESTLRALVQAVETKDLYTRGHSERVGKAAQLIARQRGLREDRVQIVHYAGMLHDVGKLGVPTRVLQKQGKLNDEEFDAIKLHPLRGYEMLAEIDFLTEALSGVYHHHERMDGRGYPMGLTEEEIPEIARIIMVADAFDSMTSTRSYRRAKTVDEAVQELRRCEGSQFDPEVVNSLVAAVEKHGWQTAPETYFGETVSREGVPIPHNDHFDPDPDLTDLRLLMGETGDGVS